MEGIIFGILRHYSRLLVDNCSLQGKSLNVQVIGSSSRSKENLGNEEGIQCK